MGVVAGKRPFQGLIVDADVSGAAGQVGKSSAIKPGADLSGISNSSQQSRGSFSQLMEESSSLSSEKSQSPQRVEGNEPRFAPVIIFHDSPHLF